MVQGLEFRFQGTSVQGKERMEKNMELTTGLLLRNLN